jgi:type II secretory pathway pseudopilin PulG
MRLLNSGHFISDRLIGYLRAAPSRGGRSKGFSLIEVVLAIGIFLITVLALIGLLGPTLQSVDEVEQIDEISSVVAAVNAFLQNSPDIETATNSKFEAIYEAVAAPGGNEATLFVYRYYDSSDPDEPIRLEVGFAPGEPVGPNSIVNQPAASNPATFADAAGPIYRVVLSTSSVTPIAPVALRSAERNADSIYTLAQGNVDNYPEGYLALEVRIFGEDPPGPNGAFATETDLAALSEIEPDFTYNTAIVR